LSLVGRIQTLFVFFLLLLHLQNHLRRNGAASKLQLHLPFILFEERVHEVDLLCLELRLLDALDEAL